MYKDYVDEMCAILTPPPMLYDKKQPNERYQPECVIIAMNIMPCITHCFLVSYLQFEQDSSTHEKKLSWDKKRTPGH